MQWGWSPPPDVPEFWNRTVSPSYFIGAEIGNSSPWLAKMISDFIMWSRVWNNCWYKYNSNNMHVSVKFFEFGFGSASIRLEGFSDYRVTTSSAESLKEFLTNCEKVIRPILNSIASSASREYRKCVPCCIKNSDIWDIDNFAGLEASEAICRVGKVQKLNITTALEMKLCHKFKKHKNELDNAFCYFSKDLHKVPYNASYRLFTDGESTIAALARENNDVELNGLFHTIEMTEVYLSLGQYFNVFFNSYHNYTSSEYEIISSKDHIFWWNLWKFKNLIEKFFDVQAMYFKMKNLISSSMFTSRHNAYMSKLYSIYPKNCTLKKYFEKADKSIDQLSRLCKKIEFLTTQYSTLSTTLFSVFAPMSIALISILFSMVAIFRDVNFVYIISFFVVIAVLLSSPIMIITSPKLKSRKLYYICRSQKRNYKKMFKSQDKRNKDKFNCSCKVNSCHRCKGKDWHRSVFYREENLCFRCGEIHTV